MARDNLAIQGPAIPFERAFPSSGITATTRSNRSSAEIFESLQLLKKCCRNGHIAAAEEAVAHLEALWDDSEEIGGGDIEAAT
jgi:hypothetical protein